MRLTPRQFDVLRKKRTQEHERQEFLVGIITSNIVNYSMCRAEGYRARPTDFMPSQWGKDNEELDLVELHQQIASDFNVMHGTTILNG